MNTINRGFKFNLHQNPKHWLKTLDLEAGSAISYLPLLHQDLLRIQVAKNIGSSINNKNNMMCLVIK
jgi:hypothetical protein